jgi:hypothetical protein
MLDYLGLIKKLNTLTTSKKIYTSDITEVNHIKALLDLKAILILFFINPSRCKIH